MRGIVIIEGADGTGKSTLARALVEKYDGFYIHKRLHRDMWLHHVATIRLAAILYNQDRLVVIDRHWISECIYAATYRDGCVYGAAARRLFSVLLRYAALHVICAPPPEFVVENHAKLKQKRVEMFDTVREVAERYHYLVYGGFNRTHRQYTDYVSQIALGGGVVKRSNSWLVYDITTDTVDDAVESIIENLERVNVRDHVMGWNFTGSPEAKFILVGDRINHAESPVQWPFCDRQGSSLYLARALEAIDANEEALAYVNAYDDRGSENLRHLSLTTDASFIPLGRRAEYKLLKLGIPYATPAPRHPQHARRFTHHDVTGYAAEIKRAFNG